MTQPRPLRELLEVDEPAWPVVQEWLAGASNAVEVLPPSADAPRELELAQVTLRSPMGAVIYHTGGMLIDRGWIRVLGSGHPRLPRSLMGWNVGRTLLETGEQMGFLLVGDDVIGGFYALNGGALGPDVKNVYYFAPDTLRWESMQRGYSDFLTFCFEGDLAGYYKPYRWAGWESEVSSLGGDEAIFLYPPLWTAEGKDLAKSNRGRVPASEVYALNVIDFPRQLGG